MIIHAKADLANVSYRNVASSIPVHTDITNEFEGDAPMFNFQHKELDPISKQREIQQMEYE